MFCRVLSLVAVALLFGCRTAHESLEYSGGNGTTVDQAVMIDDALNMSDVIRAEDHWVRLHFRDGIVQRRDLASDPLTGDRVNPCERVEFRTTDGETRVIYFQYPFACVPGQIPAGNK